MRSVPIAGRITPTLWWPVYAESELAELRRMQRGRITPTTAWPVYAETAANSPAPPWPDYADTEVAGLCRSLTPAVSLAVATAVSRWSSDMPANDCHRLDWLALIPKSPSVVGFSTSGDTRPWWWRSPRSADKRSSSPALRSARTLISVAHWINSVSLACRAYADIASALSQMSLTARD